MDYQNFITALTQLHAFMEKYPISGTDYKLVSIIPNQRESLTAVWNNQAGELAAIQDISPEMFAQALQTPPPEAEVPFYALGVDENGNAIGIRADMPFTFEWYKKDDGHYGVRRRFTFDDGPGFVHGMGEYDPAAWAWVEQNPKPEN